jgi:hypothetical protein
LKGQSEQQQAAEAEHAFRHALGSSTTASPAPLGMAYNNLANLISLRGRASEAEHLLRLGLQLQPLAYQYNGLANLLLELPRGGSRRGVQYNSMARVEEAEELMRGAIVQERHLVHILNVQAPNLGRSSQSSRNLAHTDRHGIRAWISEASLPP